MKRKNENGTPQKNKRPNSVVAVRNDPRSDLPELKYFDTTWSSLIDATPENVTPFSLNLIPQGDTEITREGNKCKLTSVRLEGTLTYTPNATSEGAAYAALHLVLDTQCNGAACSVADVLTGGNALVGLPNVSNNSRFRIIKSWKIPFISQAHDGTVYGQVYKKIKYYRKLDIPLKFTAGTGAITELTTNNLLFIAGVDAGEDDKIALGFVSRVSFSDSS